MSAISVQPAAPKSSDSAHNSSERLVFVGLYSTNERRGPGLLVYEDGTLEVGLWIHDQLVRVLSDSEVHFSLTSYPEFDYNRDDVLPVISFNKHDAAPDKVLRSIARDAICPSEALNYDEPSSHKTLDRMATARQDSVDTRQLSEYDRTGQKSRPVSSRLLPPLATRSHSVSVVRGPQADSHDPKHKSAPCAGDHTASSYSGLGAFEQQQPPSGVTTARDGEGITGETIIFRPFNPTPSSIEMQKHILSHESGPELVHLNVSAILSGDRSVFDPPPEADQSLPGASIDAEPSFASATFAASAEPPHQNQRGQSATKKGRRGSITNNQLANRRGSINNNQLASRRGSIINNQLANPTASGSSFEPSSATSSQAKGSPKKLSTGSPDKAQTAQSESTKGPEERAKGSPPKSGRRNSLTSRRLSAQFGRPLLPDSASASLVSATIPEMPVENIEGMHYSHSFVPLFSAHFLSLHLIPRDARREH